MKPARVIGILFGLGMMALAVGAFFSGEPASLTTQGRVVTIVVGLMGLLTFVNNVTGTAVKTAAPPAAPPTVASTPPPAVTVAHLEVRACPSCGKGVSSDHRFCPYCGIAARSSCPSCGKETKSEFNVCPYCGTKLK